MIERTLLHELHELTKAVRENTLATRQLTHKEGELMSTAADAVTAVNQLITDVAAATAAGNALVQALQDAKNNPSAVDQATLDQLVSNLNQANQQIEAETAAEQAAVAPPAPPPA